MDKNELRKLIRESAYNKEIIDALWELYDMKIMHHDQNTNVYYGADKSGMLNGIYGQTNDLVNRSPSTSYTEKL